MLMKRFYFRGRLKHIRLFYTTPLHSCKQLPSTSSKSVIENLVRQYNEIPIDRIRNFAIVAHVDHGKSTLADRLLQLTRTVISDQAQFLDKLQVERERGITVKAQAVSMLYEYSDGRQFILNLIDTPGHVDFAFEVTRSLRAADAVLFLVDANKGVQAQTVNNFWACFEANLEIIPVINKIDIPNVKIEDIKKQLKNLFDIDEHECLMISAKLGTNVESVFKALINRCPPPKPISDGSTLISQIIDSWYVPYRGAVAFVNVRQGQLKSGDTLRSLYSNQEYTVKEIGVMRESEFSLPELKTGMLGYCYCGMRSVSEAHVGDTLSAIDGLTQPLPEFELPRQTVYAGIFPIENADYDRVRSAIEQLCLNDASVTIENETSPALGYGWRMGFLGLLHLQVFTERLQNEYSENVVVTAPSVPYRAKLKEITGIRKKYDHQDEVIILTAQSYPIRQHVQYYMEPLVAVTIIAPFNSKLVVEEECARRRAKQTLFEVIDQEKIMFKYDMPLAEVIVDFCDVLKTITSGYSTIEWHNKGYQKADLVVLEIRIRSKPIHSLSCVMEKHQARKKAGQVIKRLVPYLNDTIIDLTVEACINGKTVAKHKVEGFRKDFSEKMKGNMRDRTRVMKQLKNQEKGKKNIELKMKDQMVSIDKKAFIDILTNT